MTEFGPKLAFLVILVIFGHFSHLLPCSWVGWWLWRAGCISQDTFLLYSVILFVIFAGCEYRYNMGGPQLICPPVNIDREAPPVLLTVVDIFASLDYFQPHSHDCDGTAKNASQ